MQTLDFDLLDDLMQAVVRRRVAPSHLAAVRSVRLGPLIELLVFQRSSGGLLSVSGFQPSPGAQLLQRCLGGMGSGYGVHSKDDRSHMGFIATSRDPTAEDQAGWITFCRKAQEAAEGAGFPKQQAQGLVGALREIEENVHLHSERAHDGIVGFRAAAEEFEFVVADNGIGILASLRKSPDYEHLNDAGTAIGLALADGNSRFGGASGHGYGFRGLFVGLANLNGELRFRSDDHALTIDGTGPSLEQAALAQKAQLQGFVVSVVCRVPRPVQTAH